MLTNRTKKNFCLVLAILNAAAAIDRAINLAIGDAKWWQLVASLVAMVLFLKLYYSYKRAVRKGNLYGYVRIFR